MGRRARRKIIERCTQLLEVPLIAGESVSEVRV